MSPVTVHVVDDDESFLRAVTRLLRASGFEVKTFASATEFLAQPLHEAQGCVVSDLQMPGMNGLAFQEAMQAAGHTMPVLFLTGNGDIPSSVKAMKQGAVDFLEKRAPKDALLAAVRRALERDASEHSQRLLQREVASRFASLSDREKQVLAEVVRGKMNKEIAADLDIHERTVKLHRTAITTKLQVQSVAELTRLWLLMNGKKTS